MRTQGTVPVILALTIGLLAVACGGESNKTDAGTDDGNTGPRPCVSDADCDEPETCQDDGFCRWDPNPDPDDNKLAGAFDCAMNGGYSTGEVTGKFDGHYIYMQYPGARAEFDPDGDPMAIVYVDGIVTNELVLRINLKVPHDSPTDTAIKFGAGGVATGTFLHLELNSDGYVVSETPVGEVIGGQIAFGEFGNGTSNPLNGTFTVELRKVVPQGD